MKTKMFVSALVLMLCSAMFVQVESVSAQNITRRSIVGIWQLSDAQGNMIKSGDFIEHKVITPTQFMVLIVDGIKNNIVIIYSGSYSLDRIDYTETIEKTTPGMEKDLKKVNTFKIETINNNFIHIVGQNNEFNQYWVRVPSLNIVDRLLVNPMMGTPTLGNPMRPSNR